mmetsp:Transcript_1796/g.4952  ORF Transcript_1796/g.4952 Transcript_1796/m.4952 type:complete len:210 (+) Transcript_1796:903-1532(+)
MSWLRNLERSRSPMKSDRRTQASLTRHSTAWLEMGGTVAAYTSKKSCMVAGSSMTGRHALGTWMVPRSSLDSSMDVPTKSKLMHLSARATACSSRPSLASPPCLTSCIAPSAVWNTWNSARSRKDTAILRCWVRDRRGVGWFISAMSWLRMRRPMRQCSGFWGCKNFFASSTIRRCVSSSNQLSLVMRHSSCTRLMATNDASLGPRLAR